MRVHRQRAHIFGQPFATSAGAKSPIAVEDLHRIRSATEKASFVVESLRFERQTIIEAAVKGESASNPPESNRQPLTTMIPFNTLVVVVANALVPENALLSRRSVEEAALLAVMPSEDVATGV
jgi:hypothetical protein